MKQPVIIIDPDNHWDKQKFDYHTDEDARETLNKAALERRRARCRSRAGMLAEMKKRAEYEARRKQPGYKPRQYVKAGTAIIRFNDEQPGS